MRIVAHSCLTTWKSLGGARTTVAAAAVMASATDETSEASDATERWQMLPDPRRSDRLSHEELLHSFFHFLLLPLPPLSLFSFKAKQNSHPIQYGQRSSVEEQKKQENRRECSEYSALLRLLLEAYHEGLDPLPCATHTLNCSPCSGTLQKRKREREREDTAWGTLESAAAPFASYLKFKGEREGGGGGRGCRGKREDGHHSTNPALRILLLLLGNEVRS
ncbi:hypothetical protein BHE74_00021989 [Ensete ventricosum]|nr:hypothetical protein BHE74_00021989 [Ensete ventricosum]